MGNFRGNEEGIFIFVLYKRGRGFLFGFSVYCGKVEFGFGRLVLEFVFLVVVI